MCLDTVYRGKQKREALAKLPESGYYWKVVTIKSDGYKPPCQFNDIVNGIFDAPYKFGWNKTNSKYEGVGYYLGFHLYRSKKDAKYFRKCLWNKVGRRIIRCKVEKKNIVSIGGQGGLCIVTTRFWCPKPRRIT